MSSQLGIPHNEKIVTTTITPMAERGGGADRGGFAFGLLLLGSIVLLLVTTISIGKFEVLRAKKIHQTSKSDVVNYRKLKLRTFPTPPRLRTRTTSLIILHWSKAKTTTRNKTNKNSIVCFHRITGIESDGELFGIKVSLRRKCHAVMPVK